MMEGVDSGGETGKSVDVLVLVGLGLSVEVERIETDRVLVTGRIVSKGVLVGRIETEGVLDDDPVS